MLIFLVGYMACGKSTIGRKLSQRLSMPLFDTDKEVVASEGMTIADIFETRGETYFREKECDTLVRLISNNENAIISTGGGTPMWGNNMALMNKVGETIYIARSSENICRRISAFGREKRPKLRGLNDEELLDFMTRGIAERDDKYRESQLVIEADRCSDDMILNIIVHHLKEKNI